MAKLCWGRYCINMASIKWRIWNKFCEKCNCIYEVLEKFKDLGKQRKDGLEMIEAFKEVKVFRSKKLKLKSKFLMSLNLFSIYRFGTSYFCTLLD